MQTLTTPLPSTRIQNKGFAFAVCFLAYLFGGTVSTLMSVYLPVAVPELLGKSVSSAELGQTGAYLNSAFLYGWMTGGLLFGAVSDSIGRIKALSLAVLLCGLFTVLVVSVTGWHLLLVYRFLAGVGVGGVLLISTVYMSEVWEPKHRPVVLGILAVAFPVGIVLTGAVTVLFSHWKQAFGLGAFPVVLSVLVAILKESEQWKIARSSAKTVHSLTEAAIEPATYRRNLAVGVVIFGSVLIGLWATFSWIPTWVQTLVGPALDGQKERGLVMMLLGMGGIAGGVASGFLIRSLGIRTTLVLTFLGCTVACGWLFTSTAFSTLVYFKAAFLSLFLGVSQGALSSYIPSLFPAHIRGTYTGLCFNIGRFFTATAVFFVGTLVHLLGGFSHSLLLFSLTFIVALLTALLATPKASQSSIEPK